MCVYLFGIFVLCIFVYLGTCYGKKALYKVRDFKGIEFYDGNEWNDNVKVLKKLCKKDSIN